MDDTRQWVADILGPMAVGAFELFTGRPADPEAMSEDFRRIATDAA